MLAITKPLLSQLDRQSDYNRYYFAASGADGDMSRFLQGNAASQREAEVIEIALSCLESITGRPNMFRLPQHLLSQAANLALHLGQHLKRCFTCTSSFVASAGGLLLDLALSITADSCILKKTSTPTQKILVQVGNSMAESLKGCRKV